MKKFTTFLVVLLLITFFVVAQQRTGNIYGTVVDSNGKPLPGVTVTLTGSLIAPMTTITTEKGTFRFLSLSPAKDYTLKAELEGFQTAVKKNIIVTVGANVRVILKMKIGKLKEEIVVTADVPVVDTKSVTVSKSVTRDELQSLPTARDPWVVLQMVPSVELDRENIGGNESGQQSGFVAKGASGYKNNIYAMDGINITDPAAIGASPTYYDFDAFEEMNVVTGGGDVTVQTGGILLNLVTRRGGNRVSLGGRFYMEDEKFQADNMKPEYKEEGLKGTNKIRDIRDYGFNFGFPIIRNKAWWWMSYGVQNIKTTTIYGTNDDTLLTNYAFKLNLQLVPNNRLEALLHVGSKKKWGRGASWSRPEGYMQSGKFHFGSPLLKIQDEQMIGDSLFLSAKFAYADAGFGFVPMIDKNHEKMAVWDIAESRFYNSWNSYLVSRPVYQYNITATYFKENLLGGDHEIKVGFEYGDKNADTKSTYNGNAILYRDWNYPEVDITGDGYPDVVPWLQAVNFWRGYYSSLHVDHYAAYIQDRITAGKLTILLGLRFDRQMPMINPFTIKAMTDKDVWLTVADESVYNAFDKLLPGLEIPEIKPDYRWNYLSPRIGFTYDLFGDGKTVLKLSLAKYGDVMGVGLANMFRPYGVGGWFWMYWVDNGDGKIQLNELYWRDLNYQMYKVFDDSGSFIGNWQTGYWMGMWGGFDPQNPQKYTEPQNYYSDAAASSTNTYELLLSIEKEIIKDLGVAIDFTFRKYDNFKWSVAYDPKTGYKRTADDYMIAGYVPDEINGISTGDAAGRPWYVLKPSAPKLDYSYQDVRPNRYNTYWGIDFVVTKRFSNNWMFNGSFTYQDQKRHYGEGSYLDPTNIWAYDGHVYAPKLGGASGKISQYIFSKWLLKMSWMYRFPLDIDIAGTFRAREGHMIPHGFTIVDPSLPTPYSKSHYIVMYPVEHDKLPTFWNVDMRIQKMFRAGENGRVYLMVDIFNVFNNSIINRRYDAYLGRYDVISKKLSPNRTNYMLNEIVNPRVVRFGIRFQY